MLQETKLIYCHLVAPAWLHGFDTLGPTMSYVWNSIFTEGIVMGGGFLIHRFFNHFLVKEHEKPAEDQKKQETIF